MFFILKFISYIQLQSFLDSRVEKYIYITSAKRDTFTSMKLLMIFNKNYRIKFD